MAEGKEGFDVNEVFEKLLFAEDKVKESAYTDGYESGRDKLLKGYHLGYHRATIVASQLGYYCGALEQYLHSNKTTNEKIISLVKETLNDIYSFPKHNDDSIDILKALEDIKYKFFKFCSLAKVRRVCPQITFFDY